MFKLPGNKIAFKSPLVSIGFLCLIVLSLSACSSNAGAYPASSPIVPASTPTKASSPASTPFKVTSVDLAVSPNTIAGKACGSSASFTYTATFHIPAGTAGGTIQFMYTTNNGRASTDANVTVDPGATTKTYTFTSSGTLYADHTYPGIAEIMVNSPNNVSSPQVKPTGACVEGAFKVTSIDMAVNPTSVAGVACGTQTTVTYTATFHLPAGNPGGTIQFMYTVNNGRGSSPASVAVSPGQTTVTYKFKWSGPLPADHTYPEPGIVMVSSPNNLISPSAYPTGQCS